MRTSRIAPAARATASYDTSDQCSFRPQFVCEPLERRLFLSHFRGATMIPSVSPAGLLTLTSTTYWRPSSLPPGGNLPRAGIDEEANPSVTGPAFSMLMTDVGSDPGFPGIALRTFDRSDSRFTKVTQKHTVQLPGPGPYSISARSCCRVAGIINANESRWEMNSAVLWDGSSAAQPISFNLGGIQIEVVRGNNYGDTIGAVGSAGLTLTYDQALNINITSQPPGMVINGGTGVISIPAAQTATYLDNTQNVGADYAFSGNIFARDASGNLRGQVEFDGMFDAVGQPGHAPVVIDATISATVGQTLTHTFIGSDPDNDLLTWSFIGLTGPGGVTPFIAPEPLNPVTPTSAGFTWNTTGSVAGTWIAQVQARDPGGLTDIGDLTINLAPGPRTGVTVITHGFQPGLGQFEALPSWSLEMGTNILGRAGRGNLFEHNPRTGLWDAVPDPSSNSGNANDEIVLVYNWVAESDRLRKGWLEAAADNLFASLRQPLPGLPASLNLLNKPLHFIGHSRGAVLNALVTNLLGHYFGTSVDHVTTLDPHPIIASDPQPGNNQNIDPGIVTYGNVSWADNYWRRDGAGDLDFDGQAVVGARDVQLTEQTLVGHFSTPPPHPRSQPVPLGDNGYTGFLLGEHSDTHLWYAATIDFNAEELDGVPLVITGNLPYGEVESGWWQSEIGYSATDEPASGRANIGYAYSRLGGTPRPTGDPSREAVTAPGYSLFNGDFRFGSGGAIPGWQAHEDGGDAALGGPETDRFLILDKKGRTRSHNRFFASAASVVKFRYRVDKAKQGSFVTALLDGAPLLQIPASATTASWQNAVLPIPLAAGVHRLGFTLTIPNGNPSVWIDNVRIELPASADETSELLAWQSLSPPLASPPPVLFASRPSLFSQQGISSAMAQVLEFDSRLEDLLV